MKIFAAILALSFFGFTAHAEQGIFIGFNQSELDADGLDFDAETGLEVGYTKHYDFGMPVMLRTGVGYVQKNSSTGGTDVELAYIEVPLTALYSFNDMFKGFAGLNLGLNVGDSCDPESSCSGLDWESLIYSLDLGAHIAATEMHHFEVHYEMGLSEVSSTGSGIDFASSLGARYIYVF